jgi:hypothetical protein
MLPRKRSSEDTEKIKNIGDTLRLIHRCWSLVYIMVPGLVNVYKKRTGKIHHAIFMGKLSKF